MSHDAFVAVKEHFEQIASLMLWQSDAIKIDVERPFQLVSGNYSPIYVNCRQVISNPVFMDLFCVFAHALVKWGGVSVDVIAGGETAGIPFAAFAAQRLSLAMVYVRKKTKAHGIASLVEGTIQKGARTLLVEDLITDAASKLNFIEAIQSAGGVVNDVLVLFDREQGGGKSLEDRGIKLHAVTRMGKALHVASRSGIITEEEEQCVFEYLKDAEEWHQKRGMHYKR